MRPVLLALLPVALLVVHATAHGQAAAYCPPDKPMGGAVECEYADADADLDSAGGGTYLALGDSLAVGTGASDTSRGADALVGRDLQASGVARHVVNLGVERETTASFQAPDGQLDGALNLLRDPSNDVRVITLSLGSNDLLSLEARPPCSVSTGPACRDMARSALVNFASTFSTILASLSDAAATQSTPPQLLVVTSYNPYSGLAAGAQVDEALMGSDRQVDCGVLDPHDPRVGLVDLQTCLAQVAGARVVDAYSVFGARGPLLTGILAGDIHPNDLGHRALAAAILAQLS